MMGLIRKEKSAFSEILENFKQRQRQHDWKLAFRTCFRKIQQKFMLFRLLPDYCNSVNLYKEGGLPWN